MKFYWLGLTFALGLILGLFLYDRFFCDSEVQIVHQTEYIEVPVEVPVPDTVISYIPKLISRIDTVIKPVFEVKYKSDTILLNVDTSEIIADFVKKRIYLDTIETGYIDVFLREEVQLNRIVSRGVGYRLHPIKTDRNFIGAGLGYYGKLIPQVYYTRDRFTFGLGYNEDIYVSLNYRLFSF